MPTAADHPTTTDPALAAKVAASLALLRQAVDAHGRVVYASSLGAEAMVLTDLIWTQVPEIDIVSIDTGRLPEETLTLLERLERRYHRRIKLYYPDAQAVQATCASTASMASINSLAERISCCQIRKLEPFIRAVAGYGAWVTGVRREQSEQRAEAPADTADEQSGLQKISPLLEWTEADIWTYIRAHQLYYSPLHDRGYPSIGCAPCTRAIEPGQDHRAGRWWWENPDSRECGLHPAARRDSQALARARQRRRWPRRAAVPSATSPDPLKFAHGSSAGIPQPARSAGPGGRRRRGGDPQGGTAAESSCARARRGAAAASRPGAVSRRRTHRTPGLRVRAATLRRRDIRDCGHRYAARSIMRWRRPAPRAASSSTSWTMARLIGSDAGHRRSLAARWSRSPPRDNPRRWRGGCAPSSRRCCPSGWGAGAAGRRCTRARAARAAGYRSAATVLGWPVRGQHRQQGIRRQHARGRGAAGCGTARRSRWLAPAARRGVSDRRRSRRSGSADAARTTAAAAERRRAVRPAGQRRRCSSACGATPRGSSSARNRAGTGSRRSAFMRCCSSTPAADCASRASRAAILSSSGAAARSSTCCSAPASR